jgi:hypothetical protein
MSSKRIALNDYVEVDGVNLSTFCRSISFASEHEQVDVSGFNTTGLDETLDGKTTQSVTCEFFESHGSNEVHQVLYRLHKEKVEFDFVWRANVNAAVGATNPELRGSVRLPAWSDAVTRGDVATQTLTFVTADTSGLVYYAT